MIDTPAPVMAARASRAVRVGTLLRQLVKYGGVSAIAFACDFGVMSAVLAFGAPVLVAATVGFLVGLVVNYALSRLWVFSGQAQRVRSAAATFVVFAIVGVLGLVLNDLVIWIATSRLSLDALVAKCLATGIVFFWNFLLRRFLLFRGSID